MIGKHPCVRVFLNGILYASKSFTLWKLCSGSWTATVTFAVWSQRMPNTHIEIFDRYKSVSWGGES